MKKILIAFVICVVSTYVGKAQTPQFNKHQTINYIDNLFKQSFTKEAGQTISNVSLDAKVLNISMVTGQNFRFDILALTSLIIKKHDGYNSFYITSSQEEKSIFWFISLESDANRLKKALEHLIELLKTEKSTDPFDN